MADRISLPCPNVVSDKLGQKNACERYTVRVIAHTNPPSELALRRYLLNNEHSDKSNTQTWMVVHLNPSGLCNVFKAVEEFSTPKRIEHSDLDGCTFKSFGIV